MGIPDRQRAARYLTHINYYRLRAYWLVFEAPAESGAHRFKAGTQFQHPLSLYVFDRKLRLLVIEAIERMEVSFRTRFAYVLGNRYGSHAYLDKSLFRSDDIYESCLKSLCDEFKRSRETFIAHYKNTYDEPHLPPIWVACEIMSFGQLSKWFQNLRKNRDREDISAIFGMDELILRSFMHHLTHVRNYAAHHSRLWNRKFTITMIIPRRPSGIIDWFNRDAERYLYNTLVMLGYLLKLMSPGTTWPYRVKQLIAENPIIDTALMGFPSNWQELSLWRAKG